MTVWVVFEGHCTISVWTTEEAARQACQPKQFVVQAKLVPTNAAMTASPAIGNT